MKIGPSLLLALAGLLTALTVASFQSLPGYLDGDYYYAGGIQLAEGKGFTEPYIWNYLDDPTGLPHPSHTYWMPLASMIAAAGMLIAGQRTYAAGRLGFLLFASLVPVVTAALAFGVSRRRDLALISGLLGVFTIYYSPFLSVTDNYGPCIVLGGLYFLALGWRRDYSYLAMGLLTGLLTLARTDGILWLGLTAVIIVLRARRSAPAQGIRDGVPAESILSTPMRLALGGRRLLLAGLGYIIIAGPWFWRTYALYGTVFAPGGGHLLWLKTYDETFVFPASQLTAAAWLAQGWGAILSARLLALKWNLLNAFAAQGGVFLAPFIVTAVWRYRRDQRVQIGVLGWAVLLLVMTIIFPFAGERGGFFHAGAALQSLWWSLAPLGLDESVTLARKRGLFTPQAFAVFRVGLVGIAVLMTGVVIAIRVLPGWAATEQEYAKTEAFLVGAGIQRGEIVMVRNPPGYFLVTGRPAVVVPYGNATSMLDAANKYQAKYVILESEGASGPIKTVYDDLHNPRLLYIGDLNGTRIFQVRP
jgi:hypothetical protein